MKIEHISVIYTKGNRNTVVFFLFLPEKKTIRKKRVVIFFA